MPYHFTSFSFLTFLNGKIILVLDVVNPHDTSTVTHTNVFHKLTSPPHPTLSPVGRGNGEGVGSIRHK
jgi:hypothetical protein